MSTISMDKEYKTRDGRTVRVLCVDRSHDIYPVIALVLDTGGEECLKYYTAEGKYCPECRVSDWDLIEVKKPVKYFKPLHKILQEHPGYWFTADGVLQGVGIYHMPPGMFKYLDDKPLDEYTGEYWYCHSWIEERITRVDDEEPQFVITKEDIGRKVINGASVIGTIISFYPDDKYPVKTDFSSYTTTGVWDEVIGDHLYNLVGFVDEPQTVEEG